MTAQIIGGVTPETDIPGCGADIVGPVKGLESNLTDTTKQIPVRLHSK